MKKARREAGLFVLDPRHQTKIAKLLCSPTVRLFHELVS